LSAPTNTESRLRKVQDAATLTAAHASVCRPSRIRAANTRRSSMRNHQLVSLVNPQPRPLSEELLRSALLLMTRQSKNGSLTTHVQSDCSAAQRRAKCKDGPTDLLRQCEATFLAPTSAALKKEASLTLPDTSEYTTVLCCKTWADSWGTDQIIARVELPHLPATHSNEQSRAPKQTLDKLSLPPSSYLFL
jgi:hypothetical protein